MNNYTESVFLSLPTVEDGWRYLLDLWRDTSENTELVLTADELRKIKTYWVRMGNAGQA